MACCEANGFTPILTHSNIRLSTLAQYIHAGIRCTLVPASVAKLVFASSDYAIIDIKDSPLLSTCLYVDTLHPKKIKNRFVEYIQDAYQYYYKEHNIPVDPIV